MNNSDIFVEDADFFRIQTVTLGYDFKRLWKTAPFSQCRFYVQGQNLFCFDKLPADMPVEGNNVTNLPVFRMYRIGVNVSF
jgi:hypothetical protein